MIKVCGMRDAENIHEVEVLGIDMMGFIFWPKSKRYVSAKPKYMPTSCKRVGVFVDEDVKTIRQIADDFALDIIQLHGSETPDFVRRLRSVCGGIVATIKAFNIATAEDLEQTKHYEGVVDYFLFDTKAHLPGGSGQQFDWSILGAYNGETPFLLSGGIGPDDAEAVRTFHHPRCIGIDLNSRFEKEPGLKNTDLLGKFIKKIRL